MLFAALAAMMMVASGALANTGDELRHVPPIEYLRMAPDQPLTLDQARHSDRWQASTESVPNLGYLTDPFWFRFVIPEHQGAQLVEISYPHLDDIQFYLLEDGQPVEMFLTGDRQPFEQRPIRHPHFVFPLTLEAGKHYEVYLHIQTDGALQVPLTLWDRASFFSHTSNSLQLHAIYVGILSTVILFNLMLFAVLREANYLYYSVSTFGYLFLISGLRGMTYPWLWPDNPWLQNQATLVAIPFALLFSLLFARSFLELRDNNPALDRLVRGGVIATLLAMLGAFVFDYNTAIKLSVALAVPTCMLLLFTGPIQWMRGARQAGIYTLAWTALTIGCVVTAVNKIGWLPSSFFTEYGMQIGSALEAILLSVALAKRLYSEREERIAAREAQLNALAARRKAELRMMDQALHNPLTGLPNRSSFEMLVQDKLARESDKRHAIGVIQLTNLQSITKTLGHTNTDRLLDVLSRRYNSILKELPGIEAVERSEDKNFYVASLDSASFGFLVDTDSATAQPRRIAQCLEQLRESVDYLGMQLPVDAVTGIALYPEHGKDTNTLIRQAYIAQETEAARERGLAYYQPTEDSYSAERLTLAADLRRALHQNQLTLHLQPKQCLATGNITGVEALIRWPERQLPADQLIEVAEQTGLMKQLTRWVLERALSIRDRLLAAGYDISIAVNISPNNLRERDFPLFVQRLMSAHPHHRGKLTLELTETSMMMDPNNSLKALKSLHIADIPLAIDDFGSGYSSLSYIKQLPAREIKIDRSLIVDLARHAEDQVIVEATIVMCHSLGYVVVAEGVEDAETVEVLQRMGCDILQGYVLARPMPLEQLLSWLAARQGQPATRQA